MKNKTLQDLLDAAEDELSRFLEGCPPAIDVAASHLATAIMERRNIGHLFPKDHHNWTSRHSEMWSNLEAEALQLIFANHFTSLPDLTKEISK